MKLFNRKKSTALAAILVGLTLSACGSADKIVSDILDDIDTTEQASISYVNVLDSSTAFYTKSTVYPDNVYQNDHFVVELPSNQVSSAMNHEWINGAEETEFAYEDGNSANNQKNIIETLQDGKRYWSLAWSHNSERALSLFEKNPTNESGKFKVRIFANAVLDISINQQAAIASTEIGEVSTPFAIEGCSDLQVGELPIDLCQSANFGSSYLVVVNNESGSVVIAQE
jgi:hypothetical protein